MSIAKSEWEWPLLHDPVSATLYWWRLCLSAVLGHSLPPFARLSASAALLWPPADKKPRMISRHIHYHAACRPGTFRERSIWWNADKRLLICDDEAAFGRFVQNVAEDLGYEARVTTDGRAFIE